MNIPTWTETSAPPAITTLPEEVREAALGFANAELANGRHPDRAISFGIARALSLDDDKLGRDAERFCVQFEGEQWVLCSDVSEERYAFDSYEEALRRGSELGRARGLPLFVFAADGGLIGSYEFDAEASGDAIHLVPGETGWVVRTPDGPEVFETKKQGLAAARAMARERGSDLIVSYRDGSIEKHLSYA
ncbi:MAG TPA: DUF2188 domain-containing protein [Myxococcota bacterium]|nr:DUF2188 domain-containing protein [Myxococcota bacterium]